jgi:hypothetical protein
MRRRQFKWLWQRLKALPAQALTRDQLPLKLGAAKPRAPVAWRLIAVQVPPAGQPVQASPFTFQARVDKLRQLARREGRYWLRSNLTQTAPAKLWSFYLQLVQVEAAFRDLKGDLAVRPVYHQDAQRIEAHIFVCFLAYCLHVSLGRRPRDLAPGLSARSVLEKFGAVQMVEVEIPTTDARKLVLRRYTQPEAELRLLLAKLKLELPAQPPPQITRAVTAPSAL